jgi:IS30 family transposase
VGRRQAGPRPAQKAGGYASRFPDDPEMWVSAETIYQSLYVRSRGALRRELTRYQSPYAMVSELDE